MLLRLIDETLTSHTTPIFGGKRKTERKTEKMKNCKNYKCCPRFLSELLGPYYCRECLSELKVMSTFSQITNTLYLLCDRKRKLVYLRLHFYKINVFLKVEKRKCKSESRQIRQQIQFGFLLFLNDFR